MYVYFVQYLRHVLRLLPLQGATAPTRDTQGVASLALGYVLLPFQGALSAAAQQFKQA